MADIAASGVTYSKREGQDELTSSSKYKGVWTVSFGDGTDTYPSGGIPLTKGSLGCPTVIETVNISEPDADDGYIYKYDDSADTIRIFQGDNDGTADGPLVELTGGATAVAAASLILEVTGW